MKDWKGESSKNQFSPFYRKIQQKFKTSKIIPAKNGKHVKAENSFRPVESNISEVFSDSDLSKILWKESYWCFPTRKTNQYLDSDERDWINEVFGKEHGFSDRNFIERISAKFIEEKFLEKIGVGLKNFMIGLMRKKSEENRLKNILFLLILMGMLLKHMKMIVGNCFYPLNKKVNIQR